MKKNSQFPACRQARSILNSQFKRSFALIELIVVIGIMLILAAFVTTNLIGSEHKASLDEVVLTIVSDLRLSQTKAMTGDTEGRGATDSYGVYFETGRYVLFHGASYNPAAVDNYAVALGNQIQMSSATFPAAAVVFQKGDGQMSGYISGQDSVTIRNTQTGEQKTIRLNRHGVIISVN